MSRFECVFYEQVLSTSIALAEQLVIMAMGEFTKTLNNPFKQQRSSRLKADRAATTHVTPKNMESINSSLI